MVPCTEAAFKLTALAGLGTIGSREYYMMEEGATSCVKQASYVDFSNLFISASSSMHGRRWCNFLPKPRRALSDRPNVLHFDLKEEKSERSYHLSFLFFLVKIGVCSVGHFCARRSSTSTNFSRSKGRPSFRKNASWFLTKKKLRSID